MKEIDKALAETMEEIYAEVQRAEELYSNFPVDVVHAAAIVAEEAGELVRAALHAAYEGAGFKEVKREAIHTAATAIRFLTFMQRMEARGSLVREHVLFKEGGPAPAAENIPTARPPMT